MSKKRIELHAGKCAYLVIGGINTSVQTINAVRNGINCDISHAYLRWSQSEGEARVNFAHFETGDVVFKVEIIKKS